MATVTVTTRQTTTGPRYVVRYRLGGRAYPVEHGGSFRTLKEARARRDLVAFEIANSRNPKLVLTVAEMPTVRTFSDWAQSYLESRVDLTSGTAKNIASHLKAMQVFADRDPQTITAAEVAEWVGGLGLKPKSTAVYLSTLRGVFDYVGLDGPNNPARDSRVRLPRVETTIVDPPTGVEVDTIIGLVPPRLRLPLRVLEQTGMRVGELSALAWGDVDESGSRFRVKDGKTAAARRWVKVPDWVMAEVAATVQREDRTPERRVFAGFNLDRARSAMARACKTAGLAHRHPHDLRHRYASVKIAEGGARHEGRGAARAHQEIADVGHVFARFARRLSRPGVVPVWSRRAHRAANPHHCSNGRLEQGK